MAHVDLNRVMTKNGKLRDEIEHLLKERCRFKELLDEQMKLLKAGKKSMLDMIEQSTIAFEHREESQAKLDSLNEKSASLKETHTQQMRDLDRLLYTDTERVEFLTIKGQYRTSSELQSKNDVGGIKKEDMETLTNNYNLIIAGIAEYADGEEKIDTICEMFRTNEDENFAIFNYVNEVNCEAESLHDAAKAVKKKIDRERALKVERVAQQSDDVRSLADELKAVQEEIDQLKEKKDSIAANLGDNTQVSLNNVQLFLLVLEKQTMRIMKKITEREKYAAMEEEGDSKDSSNKAVMRKHKLRLSRKKVPVSPIPE